MASVYENYRIINASAILSPATAQGAILVMDVDPNNTPANPNNDTFILDDTAKLYNCQARVFETCEWHFEGFGIVIHSWTSTSNLPTLGAFLIGNRKLATSTGSWDARLQLGVEFANPK